METPRDEEYSRVTDPERRLDRFGVCDTMIVEWLDVPRLDEIAQGSAQLNWHGTRRLLTIHPAPCPD